MGGYYSKNHFDITKKKVENIHLKNKVGDDKVEQTPPRPTLHIPKSNYRPFTR